MFDTYPLVYIIIVSWNSRKQLEYCLPTVAKTDYPNCKVLVVDNNSEDDTVDFVRKDFPDVELIQNVKNRGYAGGNNDGIRYALARGAEYVAIINPDIKTDPRWIKQAVKAAQTSPRIGIVGFKVFGEQKDEKDKDLQFEIAKAKWEQLIIEPIPSQVVLSGNALFCYVSMFERLGFFDEIYFCYGEESDLEDRARRAGYEIIRINVPVWHEGEGSFQDVRIFSSYLSMRNTIRYALKNKGIRSNYNILKYLIKIACSLNPEFDMNYRYHQRLRPSKIWVNAGLLFIAYLWNLFHLPQTLIARWKANSRILSTRALLKHQG